MTLFDVKIVGPQLEILATLSEQIADFMRQTAGFVHVVSDLQTGKRTFEVVIDRDAAINYGIRIEELTAFINRQLQGSTPTQFVDFVDRIDIRVRAARSDELDPQRILSLQYPVQRKDRTIHVPLSQLIRLKPSQSYEEIHREDQTRTATITATLQGIDRAEAQAKLTALLDRLTVPSWHWVAIGTHYAQMQEQYRNLYVLVALAAILVYCILAAQFESLVVPL